jgi:hypothetical protein
VEQGEGQGRPLPTPANEQFIKKIKDRILGSTEWAAVLADIVSNAASAIQNSLLTTRGDMIRRGASAPERFAKGATNTILRMGADDPDWGTLSALLDAVVGSGRGTLLHRGNTSWGALAPGTSGHFLKSNGTGADLSYAAVTLPTWTLIETRTIDGVEDFTNLGGYREIMMVVEASTASTNNARIIRTSEDNGSTFLDTSGNYISITENGVPTNLDSIITTDSNGSARTFYLRIPLWNVAGPIKPIHSHKAETRFINRTAAQNAIRLSSISANPNGGTIYLLGIAG